MSVFRTLKRGAIVSLLCAGMLLTACAGNNEAPDAGTTAGTTNAPVTTVETTAETTAETAAEPAESTNVIYQNEVEENMSVYNVKTFESLDAVDWDSVTAASVNNYKWVECTEYETWAKLVYVKDWGFLCQMTCMEDDPVATYENFGDTVCLDSCMEFFAIFDNGSEYLNIESNAKGTLCLEFGMDRGSRRTALRYLKADEMFVVTPTVEEGKWTLTMELPFEKLQKFYGADFNAEVVVPGYTFTGNFYKTGGKDNTGNEHYAMWNVIDTENPDFHQPSQFGKFIIE